MKSATEEEIASLKAQLAELSDRYEQQKEFYSRFHGRLDAARAWSADSKVDVYAANCTAHSLD